MKIISQSILSGLRIRTEALVWRLGVYRNCLASCWSRCPGNLMIRWRLCVHLVSWCCSSTSCDLIWRHIRNVCNDRISFFFFEARVCTLNNNRDKMKRRSTTYPLCCCWCAWIFGTVYTEYPVPSEPLAVATFPRDDIIPPDCNCWADIGSRPVAATKAAMEKKQIILYKCYARSFC